VVRDWTTKRPGRAGPTKSGRGPRTAAQRAGRCAPRADGELRPRLDGRLTAHALAQVAGCWDPREPMRSAAADPDPGRRRGAGELLPLVGSSSVTAYRRRADQGGRHARMAVGTDYPDRAGRGGIHDAGPSAPLTPPHHRPGHGWRSCSTRATARRRGRRAHARWAPRGAHRLLVGGHGRAAAAGASGAGRRRPAHRVPGRAVRPR